MTPGICRVCGCTDVDACEGGCVWADSTATLCSQCVGDDLVERGEVFDGTDRFSIGDDFVDEDLAETFNPQWWRS